MVVTTSLLGPNGVGAETEKSTACLSKFGPDVIPETQPILLAALLGQPPWHASHLVVTLTPNESRVSLPSFYVEPSETFFS